MKSKAKQITKEILKGVAITGLVAGVIVFPGMAPLLKWIDDFSVGRKMSARRSYYSLKKKGFLKVQKKKSQFELRITEKGKRKLLKDRLAAIKTLKEPRWDGRWRIVMFDVPEAFRTKRDLIRKKLRELEFLQIQKSVYVSPYPCAEFVNMVRDYYFLEPGQIYVFDSNALEGEELLRKHFDL